MVVITPPVTGFSFKWVRIPRARGRFEQGFLQNWSDEVFVVVQCVGRVPVYKLKEVTEEKPDGIFYYWELQRVIKPMDTYFKIEKIIDQKTEGRKKFYLVKYKGYPMLGFLLKI